MYYAEFDPAAPQPTRVLGWYNANANKYDRLPSPDRLLELTQAQWAGRMATPYVLNGGLVSDPPLTETKKLKTSIVERERDMACVTHVTVHNRPWLADERSQQMLIAAILLNRATVGLLSPKGYLPKKWRDAAGANMNINAVEDLIAIAVAIAQQTEAAYEASWSRKDKVDKAKDKSEVDAA